MVRVSKSAFSKLIAADLSTCGYEIGASNFPTEQLTLRFEIEMKI